MEDIVQEAFTTIPDDITLEWVERFHGTLKSAILEQRPLEEVLPEDAAACILSRISSVLDNECTVLDVAPSDGLPVVVVGDTHGQFLDVLWMLNETRAYEGGKYYIFNEDVEEFMENYNKIWGINAGDIVDRGSWGVELFLGIAVLKLANPSRYVLLRGNHESSWCTKMYGFQKELESKYPHKRRATKVGVRKLNIGSFIKVFKLMPLAAVVAEATLVVHGGLWRKPAEKKRKAGAAGCRAAAKSAKCSQQGVKCGIGSGDPEWMPSSGTGSSQIVLGTLKDLRNSGKGGADPLGQYASNTLATDVLWSDPVQQPGLASNECRGVGMLFGPDVTQRFLEAHKLQLIVRSHEGPDARYGREDMQGMEDGFTVDHDTPAGKLVTVFSAPDYPQHQTGDNRFENKASVLQLQSPSYSDFNVPIPFAAVPRPPAPCFYDLDIPGSDEELNIGADAASDVSEGFASSGVTSANGDEADDAGQEDMDTEEVSGKFVSLPEPEPANKDISMDYGPSTAAATAAMKNQSISMSASVPVADSLVGSPQIEAAPNSCADMHAASQPADDRGGKAPDPDILAGDDISGGGDIDASGELDAEMIGRRQQSHVIRGDRMCRALV